MDAAFAAAKDAPDQSTAEGRRKIKAELARRFPEHSRRVIAGAYRQARALVNACYDTGDLCRAARLTREKAIAKLTREFPGFSRAVYESAVGYGMFISR